MERVENKKGINERIAAGSIGYCSCYYCIVLIMAVNTRKGGIMRKVQQIRNDMESNCISLTGDDSIMNRRAVNNEVEQTSDDIEQQEVNEKGRKEKIMREAPAVKGDSGKRITSSMRLFANGLLNGLSRIDAYCAAYQPTNSSRSTITANASKLFHDKRITLLMESVETQTNARIVDDQVAVRRYVMEQLHQHSIDAKTTGDKLRALEMLGRSVALFTDKVETKTEAINADQLKKDLRNHLVLLDNVRPIKTIEIIAEDAVILRDESL